MCELGEGREVTSGFPRQSNEQPWFDLKQGMLEVGR